MLVYRKDVSRSHVVERGVWEGIFSNANRKGEALEKVSKKYLSHRDNYLCSAFHVTPVLHPNELCKTENQERKRKTYHLAKAASLRKGKEDGRGGFVSGADKRA